MFIVCTHYSFTLVKVSMLGLDVLDKNPPLTGTLCCVDVCDVELMKACCPILVKMYFQTFQASLRIICLRLT